jgi:hypothetical protein
MELYQFRENLKAPYELNEQDDDVPLESPFPDDDTMILPPLPIEAAERQDMSYPNGVFTLLTNCYSPTCTKDAMCYSISCPRRMEKVGYIYALLAREKEFMLCGENALLRFFLAAVKVRFIR